MNSTPTKILHKLFKYGWVEIENISSDDELIDLSQKIGQIIAHPNGDLIGRLTPNIGWGKVEGTFSKRFGFGNFPLHTDTAFWATPARFVLLSSVQSSLCATLLVSMTSLFSQLGGYFEFEFKRAIFKVRIPSKQFYTSLVFIEGKIEGMKYDSACMIPVNTPAKLFAKKMATFKIRMEKIHWTGKKVLIFDNWKMLHAREAAIALEKRELSRIYIK